jgi:hypothetical protein
MLFWYGPFVIYVALGVLYQRVELSTNADLKTSFLPRDFSPTATKGFFAIIC